MKDIVITAGTATGSVMALAEAITSKVGCKAYVLCTNETACRVFASSRFIKSAIYIKANNEQEYIAKIQNWFKTKVFEKKPILYSTNDTSCFYIDNNRDWFETNFDLCLPSSNIVQRFTQKGQAESEASKAGLTIPKTIVLEKKYDIDVVISEFSFPVILKPRATYLKQGVNFKIKVFKDKKKFIDFCSKYIENDISLLCQEFIPGGNDSSFYYIFYRNQEGNIFDNMGRKTLQSTPDGGIMLKGLTEYNEQLSELSKNFLNTIDYQGIGGIEFKKYNEKFYFIEMSVRLEGFYKICEASNSYLSLISYYDITGLEIPSTLKSAKQIDGVVYTDLISTLKYYLKNKNILTALQDLTRAVTDPKSKINNFSAKDAKPFMIDLALKLLRK